MHKTSSKPILTLLFPQCSLLHWAKLVPSCCHKCHLIADCVHSLQDTQTGQRLRSTVKIPNLCSQQSNCNKIDSQDHGCSLDYRAYGSDPPLHKYSPKDSHRVNSAWIVFRVHPIIHEYSKSYTPFWETKRISFAAQFARNLHWTQTATEKTFLGLNQPPTFFYSVQHNKYTQTTEL